MMNPSVNHDVKGVMAAISNGDVSLELARRKIAWLDLLPFPMHVDADAKGCLNFIKTHDMGIYVRLLSAMARLHHAFFDALGGLDNVCVIAQSSIVGGSKYNNVFRHFFAEVENQRFAFVHIDVDLYQPTRDSIEFFYPRLNPGGILLLDDYGFRSCPGATAAADEFFTDKDEAVANLPTGQGVVVKAVGG